MPPILRQSDKQWFGRTLTARWTPTSIRFVPAALSIIDFSNGQRSVGTCVHCPDTPCARFSDNETAPTTLAGFPADRLPDTCATGAIEVAASGAPVIEEGRCISCGVCAVRCPFGAIRLEPGRGAVVEDSDRPGFVRTREKSAVTKFAIPKRDGVLMDEDDYLMRRLFTEISQAHEDVGDRFPNLFARNLLLGLRIGASMTRKGNTHMRMDLLLSPLPVNGIAEVEFGQEAALDAPRSILDAMAVLVSRHGWVKKDSTALIITDLLPNKRSEYWHIIQDIAKVTGVRIGTLTTLALVIATWSRMHWTAEHLSRLYADRDTTSYKTEVLEKVIGRPLKASQTRRPEIDFAK